MLTGSNPSAGRGCEMSLFPGPPLAVAGLQRWLSAHAERVVTASHDFQVAGLCKPSLHDSLCLLATFCLQNWGRNRDEP